MRPRLWIVALALAFSLASGYYFHSAYQAGKAKETEAKIQNISTILDSEQPSDVSSSALVELLKRHDAEWSLKDSWGTDIEVTLEGIREGKRVYRVRSYGRDKKKGDCCRGKLERDLDGDAVKVGGEWLQNW